jgi:hypothetical protein
MSFGAHYQNFCRYFLTILHFSLSSMRKKSVVHNFMQLQYSGFAKCLNCGYSASFLNEIGLTVSTVLITVGLIANSNDWSSRLEDVWCRDNSNHLGPGHQSRDRHQPCCEEYSQLFLLIRGVLDGCLDCWWSVGHHCRWNFLIRSDHHLGWSCCLVR